MNFPFPLLRNFYLCLSCFKLKLLKQKYFFAIVFPFIKKKFTKHNGHIVDKKCSTDEVYQILLEILL